MIHPTSKIAVLGWPQTCDMCNLLACNFDKYFPFSVGFPFSIGLKENICHKEHDFQCNNGNCIDVNDVCNGQSQCSDGSDEDRNLCNKPFEIKLVGGPDERTGRILVRHRGVWGTVCDDHFRDEEAKVVCRMLRLPSNNAKIYKKVTDYADEGPVWIHLSKDDNCDGDESNLNQCKQSNLWEHDYKCSHAEVVAVICE